MLTTNLRHSLRHPVQAGQEEIRINAVSGPSGVCRYLKRYCVSMG